MQNVHYIVHRKIISFYVHLRNKNQLSLSRKKVREYGKEMDGLCVRSRVDSSRFQIYLNPKANFYNFNILVSLEIQSL